MKAATAIAVLLLAAAPLHAETFCGLPVEPECDRAGYDRHDYPYSASIEWRIAEGLCGERPDAKGWMTKGCALPYMRGTKVRSIRDTDIEHIVAAAEGHDSGLCRADAATRRSFGSDLDNLTLALPSTNRWAKSDEDAAGWMPDKRKRWYASKVVQVKRKYGLSIDAAERDALAAVLGEDCGRLRTFE